MAKEYMFGTDSQPLHTKLRNLACTYAKTANCRALDIARRIDAPWFRAQGLAWVARFGPAERVVDVCEESLESAQSSAERYQYVGASAWPVRCLIETGHEGIAAEVVGRIVRQAKKIEPHSSQSEALILLLHATLLSSEKTWQDPFNALLELGFAADIHWRTSRNLRDAVLMVASVDRALAKRAADTLPDGKIRSGIRRRFDLGKLQQARAFFWADDSAAATD